jgi:hypothetical protein
VIMASHAEGIEAERLLEGAARTRRARPVARPR